MLAPETRTMLTDSLSPPEGWSVDTAIATTYSLDLTALLLAPMSFALHETKPEDLGAIDQVKLLDALRRYAGRTTLFVQAGGIHPPSRFSVLMQLLEGSICQVQPPSTGKIFHPKVWVLRFRNTSGGFLHRVLVLSRNLTFDRSWDTLLQLDETDSPELAAPDVAPLVSFVRALPGLATDTLERDRTEQVGDLATTLATARFAVPSDFDSLDFLPLGLGSTFSLPTNAKRSLLISPFLDKGSAARWIGGQQRAIVLSRPESLDRIGAKYFDGKHEAWTLKRPAEVAVGEDTGDAERATSERATVRDGLHAKTFVFEDGPETTLVTGSANLTTAAFGGNVEFSVALSGQTSRCGINTMWNDGKESPGLGSLAERYTPQDPPEDEQGRTAMELQISEYHRQLSASPPTAHLVAVGPGTVDVTLTLAAGTPSSPGETFIRPASLPAVQASRIGQKIGWRAQVRRDVTPFFTVETTMRKNGISVTGHCVIVAALTGDVGDRRGQTMSEILRHADDVLRYLSLLLADPRLDVSEPAGTLGEGGAGFQPEGGYRDLVILEPLIRASLRDDEALDRVASLLSELQDLNGGQQLLPDGFAEIWEAVDQVRKATP